MIYYFWSLNNTHSDHIPLYYRSPEYFCNELADQYNDGYFFSASPWAHEEIFSVLSVCLLTLQANLLYLQCSNWIKGGSALSMLIFESSMSSVPIWRKSLCGPTPICPVLDHEANWRRCPHDSVTTSVGMTVFDQKGDPFRTMCPKRPMRIPPTPYPIWKWLIFPFPWSDTWLFPNTA